jgi:hypothetical protein
MIKKYFGIINWIQKLYPCKKRLTNYLYLFNNAQQILITVRMRSFVGPVFRLRAEC